MPSTMLSAPRRGAIIFGAVALLVAASSAPALAAQEQPADRFERTVPLAAGGSFSLSNVNGSVQIEGWDREEAQISAIKASAGGAEELDQVEIAVHQSPGGVSVETRYPRGGRAEVSVEYRVRVPARVRLALVSTVNGSVGVRNVFGAGRLVAINGNVVLARGAGCFSARATNGNVSLELVSLEGGPAFPWGGRGPGCGGINAQTVNGSVVVALPADAGADLEARTQNGDFSSDVPLLAESSSAGRVIRGRIGEGGPAVALRTVNGSIRLRIARPLV
jgi:DUF4097 and DUF4098 domain-containing protein YvlB